MRPGGPGNAGAPPFGAVERLPPERRPISQDESNGGTGPESPFRTTRADKNPLPQSDRHLLLTRTETSPPSKKGARTRATGLVLPCLNRQKGYKRRSGPGNARPGASQDRLSSHTTACRKGKCLNSHSVQCREPGGARETREASGETWKGSGWSAGK